jgi:gliding motility-associated-like protein
MVLKFVPVLFVIALLNLQVKSQTCTTPGQNPSTAFPVCGTATFSQNTVPYCGGKSVPGPCGADGLTDINPFWYKFTCFTGGTLGFLIIPNDLADDYDWQLFDITGHNPNDVFSDASLFVACNWSGNPGNTGASISGSSLKNCAGYAYPTFSAMPLLVQGHNYILLISHFTVFTPSQNGYELSFGGGTANITDPLEPEISSASSSCDATKIVVKFNKKLKCNSLAANGSDFSISPAVTPITGASGAGCSTGFDMDSVTLTVGSALPPGNYTITIKDGADGNTLLDACDREIPSGDNVPLTILPLFPTPMDSLTTVGCSPQTLQLVFKKNILCSSIAANGSDFLVTGTTPVTVLSAQGNCTSGVTNVITVSLSAPITTQGNYTITLVQGNDGNTIFDECGQETPAGSALNFSTKDTVSADFSFNVIKGCKTDVISFNHDGRNGVNQWLWSLDDLGTSNQQNPVATYTVFGLKQIALAVTNGVCSDTTFNTVLLDNTLTAAFETNNLLCPEDAATFINNSVGDITNYYWDFGNGTGISSQTPTPVQYPVLSLEKIYNVRLIVKNNNGCFDTTTNAINVLKSCYIAVPNAFTPNGDGLNDYLYPTNAYKADSLEFNVYNRLGQLVFHTTNWSVKWDGSFKGLPQDQAVFVWILSYTNRDTGKRIFQKGSTMLIR